MSFLYRRKSNYKQNKHTAKQDKIAECIVKRCITAQDRASKILQDKFEMLSMNAKRFVLGAFCIVSFSVCIFLILRSFNNRKIFPFSITAISVPTQAESELRSTEALNAVTKTEFERIIKFRGYLDSLAKSEPGKKILDSILINRSGLVDSLLVLENMYQLPLSNK